MSKMSLSHKIATRLQEQIARGEFSRYQRLPTIRILAKRLGTSPSTIQAAIQLLAKKQWVDRIGGSGVYLRARKYVASSDELNIGEGKSRSQQIADAILADIMRGTYKAGRYLPIPKELAFQYKTSLPTIRTALTLIAKQGLITKMGRSFMVGVRRQRFSKRTKVLVSGSFFTRNIEAGNISERAIMFWKEFEKELGPRNIVQYQRFRGNKAFEAPDIAGIAIMMYDRIFADLQSGKYPLDVLEQDLHILFRNRVPVIMMHHTVDLPLFSLIKGLQKKALFMCPSDFKAGEEVARYVMPFGHCSIAYFDFFCNEYWVDLRHAGFVACMEKALGKQCRIQHYQGGFKRKEPAKGFSKARTKYLKKAISKALGNYAFLTIDPCESALQACAELIPMDCCRSQMTPLFEQALKQKSVTAWVCSESITAHTAFNFLCQKGIRVGRHLSLIAIDDNATTLQGNITAYDFQYGLQGYLAAHCILRDIPIGKDRHGIIEWPGRIVERGTVGRS